jgi:protocatechuate 3,4-dioxygenase beta subunit
MTMRGSHWLSSASGASLMLATVGAFCALGGSAGEVRAQAGAEAALLTLQSTNSAMGAGRIGDRFRLPEFPGTGDAVVRGGGARQATLPRRPRSGAPGEVSGRLVDETGAPVAGIAVGLLSTDARYAPEFLEAMSDSTGRFRFTKVEPGPWEVRFDPAKLPARYAPRRAAVALSVSRSERKQLSDLVFLPGACALGSVRWTGGPPALETEIFFAPADTAFFSITGRIDGEGVYRLCGIPAGPVHAWSDLGDGRWLGRPLQLKPGTETEFDLTAEPSSRLSGTSVWFDARTEDGRPIAFAEIVVFGVREATDAQPHLVYLRGAVADRVGAAEFLLPYGTYEVLAINPREGEWTRTQGLVIDASTGARRDQQLVLASTSTASQRADWVHSLRLRAEESLYLWSLAATE